MTLKNAVRNCASACSNSLCKIALVPTGGQPHFAVEVSLLLLHLLLSRLYIIEFFSPDLLVFYLCDAILIKNLNEKRFCPFKLGRELQHNQRYHFFGEIFKPLSPSLREVINNTIFLTISWLFSSTEKLHVLDAGKYEAGEGVLLIIFPLIFFKVHLYFFLIL